MIRAFTQNWTLPGRRRVGAFLLAICLNLAIIPCAMALEVDEPGHDCCPPEIRIEAAECCELDAVTVDGRTGTIEPLDAPDLDTLPALPPGQQVPNTALRRIASVDPPDPPGENPRLYDLYCVYLK